MLDVGADARRSARTPAAGPPLDFQSHLAALEAQGLLVRVDRPINKDTEVHPLVRWQFQGGLAETEAGCVRARGHPVPPVLVDASPCQAVVIKAEALRGPGKGLARLPVPI